MLIVTPDYVTQTVAPTVEPITATEAKLHCRVDISTDDSLIAALIVAARQYCEYYTGRAFVTRTLRADICYFYDQTRLPHKPIQSISSVKYYNTASPSVLTTLDSGVYALVRDMVVRNDGQTWPSVYPRLDAIEITYVAGYESTSSPLDYAAAVPDAIKQAMYLVIGDLYENREGQVLYPGQIQVNKTVNMLLDSYRVYI